MLLCVEPSSNWPSSRKSNSGTTAVVWLILLILYFAAMIANLSPSAACMQEACGRGVCL